jgi:hypothetical protein
MRESLFDTIDTLAVTKLETALEVLICTESSKNSKPRVRSALQNLLRVKPDERFRRSTSRRKCWWTAVALSCKGVPVSRRYIQEFFRAAAIQTIAAHRNHASAAETSRDARLYWPSHVPCRAPSPGPCDRAREGVG